MARDIINAQSYFEAAREHISAAKFLYDTERFALSVYVAGLSVECLFRAYMARNTAEIDEKHDLKKLYDASRFGELPIPHQIESSALGVLIPRWRNAHRFRSQKALSRFLKNAKLDRGVKGDFLKENCRKALSAALEIVNVGVSQWKI